MISLLLLPAAHRTVFHHCAVRTSTTCYGRFILATGRSLGFASNLCHFVRPVLGLGFPAALRQRRLTLARHGLTRRLILQKARRHTAGWHSPARTVLRLLISTWFQVLLTSLPGFFSSIAHATCSLSVTNEYLALGGGPPEFTPGSTWPTLLGAASAVQVRSFPYRAITFYGRAFQSRSGRGAWSGLSMAPRPRPCLVGTAGLGSSPFARRYLGTRCCFTFLGLMRCFTSPGLPPPVISSPEGPAFTRRMPCLAAGRVVPLGDLGIWACLAAPPSFSQPSTSVFACWCLRHPPCTLGSLIPRVRLDDCASVLLWGGNLAPFSCSNVQEQVVSSAPPLLSARPFSGARARRRLRLVA